MPMHFPVQHLQYFSTLTIIFFSLVFSVRAETMPIVAVAVIDSGIDDSHNTLSGRVVGGYDFTGNNNPFLDKVGHGTAMASIIAADGAAPGLCLNCRLVSLKVTDSLEAPVERIARAIDYAVTIGVEVIYIGAGSNSGSEDLRIAVDLAAEYGITVVAPAGTQGLAHPLYPAAYESVLSVVGVTWAGQLISRSNRGGPDAISAPGYRIVAAKPSGGYRQVSGSSPAAAWVAGLVGQQRFQSGRQAFTHVVNSNADAPRDQQKTSVTVAVARLQYADTDDEDIVVDAPWRTIREYLPVLFFTPEFEEQILSIELFNYDPANRQETLIFSDDLTGATSLQCPGQSASVPIQFIDAEGRSRGPVEQGEKISSFWHYIARVPVECIGGGSKGEHFLLARVHWSNPNKHEYTRVMRVIVDDEAFPKFHNQDRYYDIHVHTIAEQTNLSRINNDAARKAFGGPIAMLLDSAFALGLVDIPLKDGNWMDFRERIATTDHNVFFSRGDFDGGKPPGFGPTSATDGHKGEFQWYREHFGDLGGEEMHLLGGGRDDDLRKLQDLIRETFSSSQVVSLQDFLNFVDSNFTGGETRLQVVRNVVKEKYAGRPALLKLFSASRRQGSHFLAYGAPHFEGPWHGGGFNAKSFIPREFKGTSNPNSMTTTLHAMSGTSGFGYAAHPFSDTLGWGKEYFNQAIGLDPFNTGNDGSVILQRGGTDFVFKGSQVWNGKADQKSAILFGDKGIDVSDLEKLDPFTPGAREDLFLFDADWERSLFGALKEYFEHVQAGLNYTFDEKPFHRFIRKMYMSAGTDAHGDFNYEISMGPTAQAEFHDILGLGELVTDDIGSATNNAFGRVRTYTLTSEKLCEDGGFMPEPPPFGFSLSPCRLVGLEASTGDGAGSPRPPREAVMAYREGNTVLTDGPIGKFSLDGNCRLNSAPNKLSWHDGKCIWENHDGGIGGRGQFDGGRTALVSRVSPEIMINSIWSGRNHHLPTTDGQPGEMRFGIRQVVLTGAPQILPPPAAGPPGKFQRALLSNIQHPGEGHVPSAVILVGEIGSRESQARFITNPAWLVPITISIIPSQNHCPIPAGGLKVVVNFGISMDTALLGAKIFVKPLDGKGQSTDQVVELTADRSWSNFLFGEFGQISDARFTASNVDKIPCSTGKWNATLHREDNTQASYAVIASDLTDMHGNSLNSVGKAFRVSRFPNAGRFPPQGGVETPPSP